jgi:hypothetical protein
MIHDVKVRKRAPHRIEIFVQTPSETGPNQPDHRPAFSRGLFLDQGILAPPDGRSFVALRPRESNDCRMGGNVAADADFLYDWRPLRHLEKIYETSVACQSSCARGKVLLTQDEIVFGQASPSRGARRP